MGCRELRARAKKVQTDKVLELRWTGLAGLDEEMRCAIPGIASGVDCSV
jgi:hypothetical protein